MGDLSASGRDVSFRPRVVVIVGPTAVGKTEIAVALAERQAGEIVSLDSRQMYRGLEIGTAKPSEEERSRAKHHLVDHFEPQHWASLAEVQGLAYAAIDAVLERGRLPIVAGGTGQYYRALVEGWEIPEVPPDAELRAELAAIAEREGAAVLHARLESVDPASAARIDPRNTRRVIRALEVHRHSGEPMSAIQGRSEPRYDFLIVGLSRDRESLYERIDRRIERMIEAGLEAEIEALLADGLHFDLPAMSALGYREWRIRLAPEGRPPAELDEVVSEIKRNTRRLVRSQANWFSPEDPKIVWIDLDSLELTEAVVRIEQLLENASA